MLRTALLLSALLLSTAALAQSMPSQSMPSQSMPTLPMTHSMPPMPTQPGQAAFAALQEIVQILDADPQTDWSKVNIEALRQHLIDMDNVTLRAKVKNEPIDGGMTFRVSGTGPVRDSIQRMGVAHAATMNNVPGNNVSGNDVTGWHFAAATTETGATLTVTTPPADVVKLRGLGFIGVLTRGMHHQMHHLMIASGMNPHQ